MALDAETHCLRPGITGLEGLCDKLLPAASEPASDPEMLSVRRDRYPSNRTPKNQANFSSAFSTVVADNQFATLGIVLLAALARLAKVAGVNYEKPTRVELKAQKAPLAKSVEDRGEQICRDDADVDSDVVRMSGKKHQPQSNPEGKPAKEKAKRAKGSSKRKKNAIDDLFSGLL